MSGDDLVERSCSEVMDSLRSRYRCVHEPPPAAAAAATPDDRGYMISLWVFEDPKVDGSESRLHPSFSNLMVDLNTIDPHVIKEKIKSVLKDLRFREEHVLVQFWSPVAVQNQWLLTTSDQPFGLGVYDEKLYSYRKKSERYAIVADVEQREKLDPLGRVYCQKMPEWSLDQDTCYNIHGYINLPVFESSSDCCVGIIEIITSSSYADFAFEVQEVSRALKNQNLKSSSVIEDPSFIMADDRARHEHDEILNVLKTVCDIHNLPLAQTWGPAAHGSYVSISGNLEQSCGSFNKSCVGKACMSTAGLPFYIRDLSKWDFHEACKERHVYKSQGVVGRSLSSCGTWFCEDVTELDEDDYPLVHRARMSGLTSCLAIYLQSIEADVERVIEIFLPSHTANEIGIRSLMETVKQQLKNSSWMQLDILSRPQVIGEISFNFYLDPPLSPINLLTEQSENETSNSPVVSPSQSVVPYSDQEIGDSDINTAMKTFKKRKLFHRSITFEDIIKHFGKTMDEAAAILKVSRSTLKRICRDVGIPRWPYNNGPYKSDSDAPLMESDKKDVIAYKSLGSLTNEPLGGTTYITHDTNAVTENGPTNVSHQANPPDEFLQAVKGKLSETVENVTIKATYWQNTVKFPYFLLNGLEKLKDQVAKRLQLEIGSFRLKYLDEDGDWILIACENDLIRSLGTFRQPESRTVIKLFVELVSPRKKRKRPERLITLMEISKHFGKTMDEAAAILKVSRSTLKRVCRSLGITRWPYSNVEVLTYKGSLTPTPLFRSSNEPFDDTTYRTHDHTVLTENVIHQQEQADLPGEFVQPETENVTIKETCGENGILKGLERMKGLFATQFLHEIGSFRLKYRDEDGDKILIARENDLTGSSVNFQYIQPNTPIGGNFCKTEESVRVKAKYGNNTAKFMYCLLDGLEKLKELIARMFQLEIGSFGLKYMDEDGDMIVIACENDLMGSSGAIRQPNDPVKTKIKLFVVLVAP